MVGDRVTVRELTGVDEMTEASTLWDAIWAREEAGHEVDPALMVALAHAGGYLAAAFDGPTMVGATLGFWGSPAYAALHSHITGVLPSQAGRGIGTMIKNHQRDWVLQHGGTAITWTYDPLVARNAHVNLNRLGARPEAYLPDLYGDLGDVLNRGDPSDRLLVRWSLTAAPPAATPHPAAPLIAVGDVDEAPLVVLGLDDVGPSTALTVAVPADITAVRRRAPAIASRWRVAIRQTLVPLLDRGWSITGFDREHGYRLEPPAPSGPSDSRPSEDVS